ncbi:ubiquitin carboxyl-hydrolase [Prevotella histicola]|nr:ubiquitin carboxyl-hydrolase [Prevotella histicola]MBW4747953.1 ubiquitin carboxyl-hydrolase [Prevotella histicola]
MMFFQSSRPRRFHHEYMYVDERKELLKELERRNRQETSGESTTQDSYHEQMQKRIAGSLRPRILRHRSIRYTALWVALALSAGLLFCLLYCFLV